MSSSLQAALREKYDRDGARDKRRVLVLVGIASVGAALYSVRPLVVRRRWTISLAVHMVRLIVRPLHRQAITAFLPSDRGGLWMHVSICPNHLICATNPTEIVLLSFSRISAYAMYPSLV